jgi:predicted NAD/FAD-binding protein
MRIAIVGTGIAGNVVAHHLHRAHDITVFESGARIGGHSNTIEVVSGDATLRLDTGFMVFNERTYPQFCTLLRELEVGSQDTSMSFSVRREQNGLEYCGSSLNALFAQRANLLRPSFHRMLRDILRFNRTASEGLDGIAESTTLGEYLEAGQYSREFARDYLVPMGAAIWSSPPETLSAMPARFFLRFFHNHGLLSLHDRPQWRVIRGGAQAYVSKLVASHQHRIRLNSPVDSIARQGGRVVVRSCGRSESFDRIFIACHSDQALRLLQDASGAEREVLGAVPYQSNVAVLHTDALLMPKRRRAWAAWNYFIPADAAAKASVTYYLNRLQGLTTPENFFVTLNSDDRIRPESVIARIPCAHPIFLEGSIEAQRRHGELNGANLTYYCGAWWRNGFHEDGVVSALAALEDFDRKENHAQLHFRRAG